MRCSMKKLNFFEKKIFPNKEQCLTYYKNIIKNRNIKKLLADSEKAINDTITNINKDKNCEMSISGKFEKEVIPDELESKVFLCLEEYYKLIGVDFKTAQEIEGKRNILDDYIYNVIEYFKNQVQDESKEVNILKLSGLTEIVIRYKHVESLMKKLVKIGLSNPDDLGSNLDSKKIFLFDSKLNDLIGIEFICNTESQAHWIARGLFNFFKIPYRTDDHLIYGFHTLNKDSGYSGLHCDKAEWYPSFDKSFKENSEIVDTTQDIDTILKNSDNDSLELLEQLYGKFNMEIQIHTKREHLWTKDEHESSYNIFSKGIGKPEHVSIAWNLLSQSQKHIELQKEMTKNITQESKYRLDKSENFSFLAEILGVNSTERVLFNDSIREIKELRRRLETNDIPRLKYVRNIHMLATKMNSKCNNKNSTKDKVLRLQEAFMYYSFSTHEKYFNYYDISQLVKKSIQKYKDLITMDNSNDTDTKLIILNAIHRYSRLSQKNGMGLLSDTVMNKDIQLYYPEKPALTKEIYSSNKINEIRAKQNTNFNDNIQYLYYAFSLLLDNDVVEDLKKDFPSYCRTIHTIDRLARDIELDSEFNNKKSLEPSLLDSTVWPNENDKKKCFAELINDFRRATFTEGFKEEFMEAINSDNIKIIKNNNFVVNFLSTLILNEKLKPLVAFKIIMKFCDIDTNALFKYEYATYYYYKYYYLSEKNSCIFAKDHYLNYHRKNMISLLFQLRKENAYEFKKARIYYNGIFDFEKNDAFKENHFFETGIENSDV